MLAREVKAGDALIEDGVTLFTVEEVVDVVPSHVKVRVRYRNGSIGLMAWAPDDELALTWKEHR